MFRFFLCVEKKIFETNDRLLNSVEAGFISEAVRFVFFLCEDLVVLMKFWVIMYDGASILR